MKTDDTLKRAVESLPVFQCPEKIWSEIEMKLDDKNIIDSVIKQLPSYNCPDDAWTLLSQKLDEKPVRKLSSYPMIAAVAASLAFVVIFGLYILRSSHQTSVAVYEEEILATGVATTAAEENDMEALQLIEAYCKTSTTICTTPEYLAYMSEFTKLSSDLEGIRVLITGDPQQVELLEAQAQLENAKAETIKNMVKFLMQ